MHAWIWIVKTCLVAILVAHQHCDWISLSIDLNFILSLNELIILQELSADEQGAVQSALARWWISHLGEDHKQWALQFLTFFSVRRFKHIYCLLPTLMRLGLYPVALCYVQSFRGDDFGLLLFSVSFSGESRMSVTCDMRSKCRTFINCARPNCVSVGIEERWKLSKKGMRSFL